MFTTRHLRAVRLFGGRKRKPGAPKPRPEHVEAVKGAGKRTGPALEDQRAEYERRVDNVMRTSSVGRQAAIVMVINQDPRAAAFLLQPAPAPKTTKTGEAPRTTGASTTAKASTTGPAAPAKAPGALAKTSTPSTAPAGASTATATYSSWINGWRYRGTLHNGFGPRAGTPGARPAPARPASTAQEPPDDGEAIEQWRAAICAKVEAGMTREAATRAVAIEDPKLRESFVRAHNARHGNGRK